MPKPAKPEIGDYVAVYWDDAVSPGRTLVKDADLPMAELVSYGVVGHIDDRKVVIRQEMDLSVDAGTDGNEMKECVLIPLGCVERIEVMRFSHAVPVAYGRGKGEPRDRAGNGAGVRKRQTRSSSARSRKRRGSRG